MPWKERAEIIESITGVSLVVPVDDSDGTVCEALRKYEPAYFANGGDRTNKNTPEMRVCEELGIEMLWNIGGGKIQSSSTLVNNSKKAKARMEKPDLAPIQQMDLFDINT